jgi:hypothetical protein
MMNIDIMLKVFIIILLLVFKLLLWLLHCQVLPSMRSYMRYRLSQRPEEIHKLPPSRGRRQHLNHLARWPICSTLQPSRTEPDRCKLRPN